MAVNGIITNIGVQKAQEAANNEGFYIVPLKFSVSNVLSALDPTRTVPNSGVFYEAPISSRVVVSYNTIKFICTLPPAVIPLNQFETIRELYIFGTLNSVDFLFAIGQPSPAIVYDPTGSTTIEIDISLTNADLSSIIQFSFTQATEVAEHNVDPNGHPDLVAAVNKAGIFYNLGGGPVPFGYHGQSFDEKGEFEGTKASNTVSGVTFTADHNGTDGNSIALVFDGTLTTDQVKLAWNNANPYNTVSHNGTGSEVISAQTLNLINGTLLVNDKDPVYKDVDGIYKQAVADGTIKSLVAGFADFMAPLKRIVRSQGFLTKTTGQPIGTKLFLSSTIPAQVGAVTSGVQLGIQTGVNTILIGNSFGSGSGTSEGFDAVVTDNIGVNLYPTTQQAIAAVPDGSRILVDKLETVFTTIDTQNKRLDIWFNGPEAGWTRYLGTPCIQQITFDQVPNSGTWRIEWNSQETTDLAFNATATDVQNAMNLLTGSALPCTVTGDYTSGFTITFQDFIVVPQITFLNPGQNEIEAFNFTAVPNNGTFQVSYNGNNSAHIAWNDPASLIETYLEAIPGITSVTVTGSFSVQQFVVEFDNVDGLQPKLLFVLVNNSLMQGLTNVNVNIAQNQQGKFPASNLYNGATHVNISVATLQQGTLAGDPTAITVTKDYTRFIGLGKIVNFPTGIDLNSHIGCDIEMLFINTTVPIKHTGLQPRRDYHREKSFGMIDPVEIYVGPFGDYQDMWTAIAAANTGDSIIVAANQSLTSAEVINKDIYIEFINSAVLSIDAFVSGSVITFGANVRTKNWKVNVATAGNYDNIFNFMSDRSHHENLCLDLAGNIVSVNNAFNLDPSCNQLYCDGAISRHGGTVTNVIFATDFGSNNVFIRDKDLDTVFSTIANSPLEEKVYATVDGQTLINFTLLQFSTDNAKYDLFVRQDGIWVFQDKTGGLGEHYRKNSPTQIEFAYGLLQGEAIVGRVERSLVGAAGDQPYFVNYYQGLSGALIATGGPFNAATDKLSAYRNGLYLVDSGSIGAPIDQYLESGTTQVIFGTTLSPVDWVAFINMDETVTRSQVTGLVGTVLTTPTYTLGGNNLRVFRNGMLLNASGLGSSTDQYTETSTTSITLGTAAISGDVFTFYVMNLNPVFRSDQTGLSGTIVTVPAFVVGDKRLHVYRNGALMVRSNIVGAPNEQYQETNTTTITLGSAASPTEWFSFIYK